MERWKGKAIIYFKILDHLFTGMNLATNTSTCHWWKQCFCDQEISWNHILPATYPTQQKTSTHTELTTMNSTNHSFLGANHNNLPIKPCYWRKLCLQTGKVVEKNNWAVEKSTESLSSFSHLPPLPVLIKRSAAPPSISCTWLST